MTCHFRTNFVFTVLEFGESINQRINEFFQETHTATHSAEEFYVMHCYKNLTIEEAFFRSNEVKDGFVFEKNAEEPIC